MDDASRTLLRAGIAWGPWFPRAAIEPLSRAVAWPWVAANGHHVRTWRTNVTVATGRPPSAALTRAGVASSIRSLAESFQLSRWDADALRALVTTDAPGEARLREALRTRGCVLALPHMASWDLAGAWAGATGMPVSTVAERLPAAEFAAFRSMRERLGMRVYSHRDSQSVHRLVEDARAGRLVCLVSDRNLTGSGVTVGWPVPGGSVPVTLPAGPALVARRSDALFMAIACHYTATGMHIAFSEPIAHAPGRFGLETMLQAVAAFFAAKVAAHPSDWHVYQPFFPHAAARPQASAAA